MPFARMQIGAYLLLIVSAKNNTTIRTVAHKHSNETD